MKFYVALLVKKAITTPEDVEKYYRDILTYIYHIDKLIIFNMSGAPLDAFYQTLSKHETIEYADCSDYGQAFNYRLAYNTMKTQGADYGTVLELDYFYEEETYLAMKRYALENEENATQNIAMITPLPLFTSETLKKNDISTRSIMGARMTGTLLNLHFYQEEYLITDYYETTFDYDYCLNARKQKQEIILLSNMVLRNRNFTGVERRHIFFKTNAYAWPLLNLYYETRNRYYLWNKYAESDANYVKLDKKMFRKEKYEIRMSDPERKEKFKMIQKAIDDFRQGIMGKYQ